jgi:ATP-dependent Clp protease ATP-binding subunit ClpA
VVVFRPLSHDSLSRILDQKMTDLYERLKGQQLTLALTDEARELILAKGHDPILGARPLRRAIERLLTRPLSARIVEDAFAPGDVILAKVEEDKLVFGAAKGEEVG